MNLIQQHEFHFEYDCFQQGLDIFHLLIYENQDGILDLLINKLIDHFNLRAF